MAIPSTSPRQVRGKKCPYCSLDSALSDVFYSVALARPAEVILTTVRQDKNQPTRTSHKAQLSWISSSLQPNQGRVAGGEWGEGGGRRYSSEETKVTKENKGNSRKQTSLGNECDGPNFLNHVFPFYQPVT